MNTEYIKNKAEKHVLKVLEDHPGVTEQVKILIEQTIKDTKKSIKRDLHCDYKIKVRMAMADWKNNHSPHRLGVARGMQEQVQEIIIELDDLVDKAEL